MLQAAQVTSGAVRKRKTTLLASSSCCPLPWAMAHFVSLQLSANRRPVIHPHEHGIAPLFHVYRQRSWSSRATRVAVAGPTPAYRSTAGTGPRLKVRGLAEYTGSVQRQGRPTSCRVQEQDGQQALIQDPTPRQNSATAAAVVTALVSLTACFRSIGLSAKLIVSLVCDAASNASLQGCFSFGDTSDF